MQYQPSLFIASLFLSSEELITPMTKMENCYSKRNNNFVGEQ
jgi:hypothetical protein